MNHQRRYIILAAPSGSGKTTVAKYILQNYPQVQFSISSTTRSIRQNEVDGKDYYFLTREQFLEKIEKQEVVEYEEIYGNYYGTMKDELQRLEQNNIIILFDIDVLGALNLSKIFLTSAVLLYIAPPSLEVLEQRLRLRSTETEEQIQKRLSRAKMELTFQNQFDYVVVNDSLEQTLSKVKEIIEKEFSFQ
ncbi:MAG: guanylate kinase [Candidatus Kapabacteria bacterium]|nr:guanylate kinase [Candidatus Kapabacteria bacterium]